MAAGRLLRILLIAEAANPEWTSVPLIGWSLYRALATVADVHLVTHVRNREALLRAGVVEGEDFTAIDNENIAAPLSRMSERLRGGAGRGWTTVSALSSIAYYSFEREVWKRFKSQFASRRFDLVHRITPLSPTSQSTLPRKLVNLNVPFVVGPLNGGLPWPSSFRARQHAEREWMSYARAVYKLMPAYRSMRKYSSAIIIGSKFTYKDMPDWAKSKCVYIPENGIDSSRFSERRKRCASIPLVGVFVGRLVPYKGADVFLEAASVFLRDKTLVVHIVGAGPQEEELRKLVKRAGVEDQVTFHGWVQHVSVQNILSNCDFLALPSVREFGGGVVLEAMAMGVTPIVAEYGGPAELVDNMCGICVPFSDAASLTDGFRSAIERVIRCPELLDQYGAAGRVRVGEHFTWNAKAKQILQLYKVILQNKSSHRGPELSKNLPFAYLEELDSKSSSI